MIRPTSSSWVCALPRIRHWRAPSKAIRAEWWRSSRSCPSGLAKWRWVVRWTLAGGSPCPGTRSFRRSTPMDPCPGLRRRFPDVGWRIRLWAAPRRRPSAWLRNLSRGGVDLLLICGEWEGTGHSPGRLGGDVEAAATDGQVPFRVPPRAAARAPDRESANGGGRDGHRSCPRSLRPAPPRSFGARRRHRTASSGRRPTPRDGAEPSPPSGATGRMTDPKLPDVTERSRGRSP